ncbi:MAG: hypothetical protein Q8O40_00185 [Chloroflexota bacterium]|nr:hypothetical protein [Chloroflexota bacterium]
MTKIDVAASIGRPVAQLVEELRDSFPGVGFLPATNPEEAVVHIRDADAFVGLPTREVYLTAQKLRWVHMHRLREELGKNGAALADELDVLVVRGLVAGRCDYCPA